MNNFFIKIFGLIILSIYLMNCNSKVKDTDDKKMDFYADKELYLSSIKERKNNIQAILDTLHTLYWTPNYIIPDIHTRIDNTLQNRKGQLNSVESSINKTDVYEEWIVLKKNAISIIELADKSIEIYDSLKVDQQFSKRRTKKEQEERERLLEIPKQVMVFLYSKSLVHKNGQSFIKFFYNFKNFYPKKPTFIRGTFTINNVFDERLISFSIFDKYRCKKCEIEIGYNPNGSNDENLNMIFINDTDIKNLKVEWKPDKILFEDGTILDTF